jgi:heme-degrading monooxygenase HmoA
MYATWTALELTAPLRECPWSPDGARFVQAGHAGPGVADLPDFSGTWWSVLALWDDVELARAAAPRANGCIGAAWHVTLEPVSYRGDAELSGGARPFESLPARGKVQGAAAVITLAGAGPDPERTGEVLERFADLGRRVRKAPGHRASMVQAADEGAALTFSAWETLRHAVTWAYHGPGDHAATVRRHEQHALLAHTGFLRCAVVATSGALHGNDPLAGLSGTPIHHQENS